MKIKQDAANSCTLPRKRGPDLLMRFRLRSLGPTPHLIRVKCGYSW